jgi:hypothetical protein
MCGGPAGVRPSKIGAWEKAMKAMLLAGTMLAMMGTANAADIKVRYESGNAWVVDIIGEIKSDDDKKFHQAIEKISFAPVTVTLESPGGDIAAGLSIGEQIRAHEFGTFVINECTSVCGLIWLAGIVRSFSEDDHLGFHAAYYSDSGKVSSEANALVGAYLSRLGFSYRTIQFLTYAAPDSMQWLTSKTAAQYGIDANVYPSFPKARSAQTNWRLYIPAIVMGIFMLGFIMKAKQKELSEKCAKLKPFVMGIFTPGFITKMKRKKEVSEKCAELKTFDKVLLGVTAVPVLALVAIFLTIVLM